jgi:hypothetical protein
MDAPQFVHIDPLFIKTPPLQCKAFRQLTTELPAMIRRFKETKPMVSLEASSLDSTSNSSRRPAEASLVPQFTNFC